MKSVKIDDLNGLRNKVGKVVGLGPGRNLDLGSTPWGGGAQTNGECLGLDAANLY